MSDQLAAERIRMELGRLAAPGRLFGSDEA
jgi:hypothetical protein